MIDGEAIRLRTALSSDLTFLAGLRSDEHLAELLASRARGSSPEQAKQWVDRVNGDSAAVLFVIAVADTNKPAGYVQITQIDLVSRRAMFGICLGEEFQGRGFGREALTLVESYLARTFNLRKLVLEVLASNTPAIALYQKQGFREVGVLEGHFFYDGKFEDVLLMEHVFNQ